MITALIVLIALGVIVQVLCAASARAAAERAELSARAASASADAAALSAKASAISADTAGLEARKAQR
ncbi:hypothetical protein ACXYTP_23565 [Tsukamurella ocularis]